MSDKINFTDDRLSKLHSPLGKSRMYFYDTKSAGLRVQVTENGASKEAISLWIETVLDDAGIVPAPGKLSDHANKPEFSGWLWAVVEIDGALLDDHSERVNISMPRRILSRIDRYASAHGETRSGFMVNAALDRILHG